MRVQDELEQNARHANEDVCRFHDCQPPGRSYFVNGGFFPAAGLREKMELLEIVLVSERLLHS